MDRLRGIVAFVRTVENRNFIGAAKVLGLTASAVSKSIGELERELGVRLLTRSTRRLTLTEEGATFYARCRDVLLGLDEAERSVTSASAALRGRLRVNIHTNIGRARIVPALPTFLARHPQLQVDVEMTSGALSVVEHGVDLVVRILDPPDSSLVARRIGGTRFVTCASPEYLRRHGVPAQPSELSRHNCLLYILP